MENNEIAENNNFDWVFTYEHLLRSAYKCKNGVIGYIPKYTKTRR